ncbi:amidohydrolase family protein [Amycolatopsis sp. CA-230715]|uniref:amidohydrolase family protein n=1 Tax=Amycolatopsis sp. CA-230715 TaxID=2745196 RepID=UPI001C01D893|nr:amidohydrolase family protein [Amycolatopsis sp. CA-230715]QWF84546.1 5-methylthioadenosine/S-adenosylhomocysteine deaminase [Amycolatopsis sp. CA-230715]
MGILVRGGTVLGIDQATSDLPRGDVLVEDGRISEVSERIDAPGAEVLDATGMLVLPGFVDTHRHTWQAVFRGIGADWTFPEYRSAMHGTVRPHCRPEDVYIGTLLGRVEALQSGITTLLDWCHCTDTPEHGDAALDALLDAPGRSVFCYGAGIGTPDPAAAELARMRDRVPGDDGLVTMAAGVRGPLLTDLDTTAADVTTARELGLRVSVHVHVLAGEADRPVAAMAGRGLLDDRTTFVHGNGLADDELAMMADAGCSVSISPDVELKMGFGWPETGRMLAAGIRPTLSIDDCPSAGGDMFSTMRTALSVQRGLDTAQGVPPSLTARDVLEFATLDGARAVGLGDRVGSITPGKQADLVLLRTDDLTLFPANHPIGAIVSAAHPGLVDTVLVAGKIVKRGGELIGVDLDALRERALRSRARIAAAAGIPLDGSWSIQHF